jgi:hypothetical protein
MHGTAVVIRHRVVRSLRRGRIGRFAHAASLLSEQLGYPVSEPGRTTGHR